MEQPSETAVEVQHETVTEVPVVSSKVDAARCSISTPSGGLYGSSSENKGFLSTTDSATCLSAADDYSSTLLQAAMFRAVATGSLTSLKLMINACKELGIVDFKENCESLSKIVNYDQRTLLHLAAAEGHVDIVSFLLDNHANPAAVDRWGATPTDDAWENGHMEIVQMIQHAIDRKQNSTHESLAGLERAKSDLPLSTSIGRHRHMVYSVSLMDQNLFQNLQRTSSSPLEVNTAQWIRNERSLSCADDDHISCVANGRPRLDSSSSANTSCDSPFDENETSFSTERSNVALFDPNINPSEEREEDIEFIMAAEDQLDQLYRSEKDKILQKYKRMIEGKLGNISERFGLLSLIR
eukprot:jgi/Galph1/4121/GphlegSOOS_G2727.1